MRPESCKSLRIKVQIARRALRLDDPTYHEILERLTDKSSSTELSAPELVRVVAYLRTLGWQEPAKKPAHRKPAVPGAAGYLDKIEALLAEAKRPWSYAGGIAKRMFGVEKLEWLTPEQVRGVMAALIRDAERHGRPA